MRGKLRLHLKPCRYVTSPTLNVVAPEAVADVGAGHAKVRLVRQVVPGQAGNVAAETDLVAVVAHAAPAGKHNTAGRGALALGV